MSNEVRKAQEEVHRRNAQATVDYTKQTRALVRENEKRVQELKNMIIQQNDSIDQLRTMITNILKERYGN